MAFLHLEKRGIGATAQAANWQIKTFKNRSGWAFPVYHPLSGERIATRWKSAEKEGMKYGWIPSKPDSPFADWYILPETQSAISNTNGTAYLANGEPALLAYHAAGIHHVIATTLSEVGIPKNLREMLTQLGISRLLYPVDNDAAGEKSALNWRDALRESGIDFEAFSWGDDAPAKADANDIWMQVDFDRDAFQQKLGGLQPLSLPLPAPKFDYDDDADFDQTPHGLIDALAARLGVTGWKSNGWARKNISSPFREDSHPSATFNRDSGVLHDFGTGESYSPTQVAEQLGIDWKAFYPKRDKAAFQQQRKTHSVTPVTVPWHESYETQVVNMPYISNLELTQLSDTNAIRSPLATGKTALISEIIQQADPNANILVITHLQALAENISERLSQDLDKPVECYHHIPHEYRTSAYRLVCSYDSLHTIRDDWDYIFIDEFEQFQRHLTSGTMRGGEPVRAFKKLLTIAQSAKHLTVMDAHLSQISLMWLTAFRGSVTPIFNAYRHDWGHITMQKHETGLLKAAFRAAHRDDSKGIVIPVNSRSKSLDYYQLAVAQFGEDAVMLINGDNSSSSDARQFIRNLTNPKNKGKALNEVFPTLRILICSPSLATGIDVQVKVSGVFGMFTRQPWVNSYNIMQMMMRYRSAGMREMCVQASENTPAAPWNPDADMQQAQLKHEIRMRGTSQAAEFGKYGLTDFDDIQQVITMFSALYDGVSQWQQEALVFWVEGTAYSEGFSLHHSQAYDEAIKDQLKHAREQRSENFKRAVMTEALLSPEAFDALRQNPDTTSDELRKARAGLERWHIEFLSGATITPKMLELLGSNRKRSDFSRLLDLLDDPDALKVRDRGEAQQQVLVIKRRHHIRNRDLVDMAGQAVFGDNWLHSDQKLTAEQIAARLDAYLRTHIDEIQAYVDRRFDLSKEPLNIFRRLLKRIGLKLGRTQIMRDGVRYYLYFIDGEYRETVLGFASVALEARQLRELLQTRTTLINIREWRNPKPEDNVYLQWKAQTADIPF